jgi:hypothetical protein
VAFGDKGMVVGFGAGNRDVVAICSRPHCKAEGCFMQPSLFAPEAATT